MADVLIGIDVGSTVLKAAAFDVASGKALAEAGHRLKLRVGADGAREQSPAGMDKALSGVLASLKKTLGKRWSSVTGIGLAAQGGSTIIVNRKTGKALTPMMVWNDTRAIGYGARVRKGTTPAFWRRHTLADGPGAGLAKILWLKDTRREIMTDDNMYVGAGEYCYFRLTGLWRQDACNALQIGCYNAVKQRLDQRLLDFADMPLSFVAPLRQGHEIHPLCSRAARLMDLPAGIPVVGPYMDHEAGYMSAIGVSRRPLQCSLGTAWVGNYMLPQAAKWRSPYQLPLPAIVGKGYLVVQALLTGNVTWDWGLAQFVDMDHARALSKADRLFTKKLLPHDGLCALPWLNIGNPLKSSAVGAASFSGIGPQTDKAELLRALAVGMTYEMARMFAGLKKKKIDSLVLGGGASKGEFFRTLLTALFDPLPVHYLEEQDLSGARGTLYAFSRKVAKAGTKRTRKVSSPVSDQIQDGYAHYLAMFENTYGKSELAGVIEFD